MDIEDKLIRFLEERIVHLVRRGKLLQQRANKKNNATSANKDNEIAEFLFAEAKHLAKSHDEGHKFLIMQKEEV